MNRVSGNNITYKIVQSLGRKIVCGDFSRSEPLPSETQLCADYGASRTVLREAVKMLTAKGLLDARPRRGTIIRPEKEWNFTDPDIIDWLLTQKKLIDVDSELLDFQLANIPTIGVLAQRNLSPDEFNKLRACLVKIADEDLTTSTTAEQKFLEILLTASQNRFMICQKHVLIAGLVKHQRFREAHHLPHSLTADDYHQIFNALIGGDEHCIRFALTQFLMRYKLSLIKTESPPQPA